ncbi:4Fe-4S binding protein [Oscillospiraceae bacterium MB08-C2-2]|nr:4Fe-4S binding protein [Oscillospiraceae bacterium MB08-C2-2]
MSRELYLPVKVAGIEFKNPFYVASGPTARTVEQLLAIEKAGWAGASLKLAIDPAPYINRYPRYALFKDRDALGFTAEKRLTYAQGLELMAAAKKRVTDLILMANITYAGEEGTSGWVNMAKGFYEAGADIIELNMCCPNMSFNVETTSGDAGASLKQTGASLGKQGEAVAEIVAAIKKAVPIPLFVKLTPEGGEIGNIAKAAYLAGADAVGGTGNRLGIPPIDLENPESAIYHLQDEISMTCYCGGWLKPLAQRDTYEMRKICGPDMPIMAAGGIRNATDSLEMVMCGADLLGICAETLIRGYDFIGDVIRETSGWLESHGHSSLRDIRDRIVPAVKSAPELTLYKGYAQVQKPEMIAPCMAVCPKGIPVQSVLKQVSERNWERAYALAAGSEHCAQCPAPCKKACVKGRASGSILIPEIMLFLREKAAEEGIAIAEKADGRPTDRPVAKASQVLELRQGPFQEPASKILTKEDAVQEASGCLRCGCGEGCHLCAEICCEFAISLDEKDQILIDSEKCVACGMCYNRCPNRNIAMINTGVKI